MDVATSIVWLPQVLQLGSALSARKCFVNALIVSSWWEQRDGYIFQQIITTRGTITLKELFPVPVPNSTVLPRIAISSTNPSLH